VERPEFLSVRVGAGQTIELGDHLRVPTRSESGLHQRLDRDDVEFLEPRRLGNESRLGRQIVEGGTPPESECLLERRRGLRRVGFRPRPPVRDAGFEVERVEAVSIHLDDVAGPSAFDHGSQHLTKLRHVRLDRVSRAVGRFVAPQSVNQPVEGHHAVRFGQQQCEHETLLGAAQCARRIDVVGVPRSDPRHHTRGTEHLESHRRMIGARFQRRIRLHWFATPTLLHGRIVSERSRKLIGTIASSLLNDSISTPIQFLSFSDPAHAM